jgi:hypothetical protein
MAGFAELRISFRALPVWPRLSSLLCFAKCHFHLVTEVDLANTLFLSGCKGKRCHLAEIVM